MIDLKKLKYGDTVKFSSGGEATIQTNYFDAAHSHLKGQTTLSFKEYHNVHNYWHENGSYKYADAHPMDIVEIIPKAFQHSELPHGLYKIFWEGGGSSLASVGSDESGARWFSPTNWVGGLPSLDWSKVKGVERIRTGETQ